jgi:hypothetical protein
MYSSDFTVAVAYLARGADTGWLESCERFLESYMRNPAGVEHSFYVILKGFVNSNDLEMARRIFKCVPQKPVCVDDDKFDIGAYVEWANMIEEEVICVFNTASEILTEDWLRKLAANLSLPNVGLVGATGSYESLKELNSGFPDFPNIHVRSNAFMINRRLFCDITENLNVSSKMDAHFFESGAKSLTRQVLDRGREVLIVGRNGRGYSPKYWPSSYTFRQGMQNNLLIADNQTRNYLALPWIEKREFVFRTWGNYIDKG